jgi:2-keto-3-deoxy-6-phosphogluconate aldolase
MQTVKNMMVNGLEILNMVLAEKLILMLVSIMVIGKMEKDMVKEYFNTKMVMFIQDGGNLVKKKELEHTLLNQLE